MKITAVYQPLWSNGREGVERYREEIEEELAGRSREEVLIIGGDHNAQIGRGEEMEGVKGKYGLHTPTNEAGHHLLEWCQEQGLSYVNSFFSHRKRGTWYNMAHRRWYELDGFLMRNAQRHQYARRIQALEETGMSDHRTVKLTIRSKVRRRRRSQKREHHR